MDDGGQLGRDRPLAIGQRVERFLGAFEQRRSVCEPPMLVADRGPFVGLQRERLELVDLPCELFALGLDGARIGLEPDALRRDRPPRAPGFGDGRRAVGEATLRIEHRALRARAQQQLMRMLAVDVDEVVAQFAQLRERRRDAVDPRLRASARVERAAQQDPAALGVVGHLVARRAIARR